MTTAESALIFVVAVAVAGVVLLLVVPVLELVLVLPVVLEGVAETALAKACGRPVVAAAELTGPRSVDTMRGPYSAAPKS